MSDSGSSPISIDSFEQVFLQSHSIETGVIYQSVLIILERKVEDRLVKDLAPIRFDLNLALELSQMSSR